MMNKKLLVGIFSAAFILAPSYSYARNGADDGPNHEMNEHGAGHEMNEHAAGHEANEHAAGHEANEHAAGHDMNEANETPDHEMNEHGATTTGDTTASTSRQGKSSGDRGQKRKGRGKDDAANHQ